MLVPNTVDVTRNSHNQLPAPSILRGYLRGKVLQFNIGWHSHLTGFKRLFPGNSDSTAWTSTPKVNGILSHASRYGFTETEIDALADVTLLDKSFDGPGSRYVFWIRFIPRPRHMG